jgi:predicted Zn-dependent protease
MIPNNLLYGIDCNICLYTHSIPKERIPEAHVRIKKIHKLHQRLQEHLTNANKQMAKYYNQNHILK